MTNFTRVFQPIPSWLNCPITSTDQLYSIIDWQITSAQVAETSVANNSPFDIYPHPNDHTIRTTDTPGFKPCTILQYQLKNFWASLLEWRTKQLKGSVITWSSEKRAPARPLIRTHRYFYKEKSGEARSRKPSMQLGSQSGVNHSEEKPFCRQMLASVYMKNIVRSCQSTLVAILEGLKFLNCFRFFVCTSWPLIIPLYWTVQVFFDHLSSPCFQCFSR